MNKNVFEYECMNEAICDLHFHFTPFNIHARSLAHLLLERERRIKMSITSHFIIFNPMMVFHYFIIMQLNEFRFMTYFTK